MLDAPMSSLRQPPANLEVEQFLLGTIMAQPKAFHRVSDILRGEHFADGVHRRIYEAIQQRAAAGQSYDLTAIVDSLRNSGVLEEAGGVEYLSGLAAASMGWPVAIDYARQIIALWQRRQIIEEASELIEAAYDGSQDVAAGYLKTAASLDGIMSDSAGATHTVSLTKAISEAVEDTDKARRGERTPGLHVGMESVDRVFMGLEPGTLNVLGGRPGSGKSSLGFQWALNAAAAGIPVFMVSLEMTAKELAQRALAIRSGVPLWRIRSGEIDDHMGLDLVGAQRDYRDLPLTIEDAAGLTAQQIALKARASKRRHGLGLVVVDHLHIVRPEAEDVRAGATWATGRISGAMKRLAKDLQCPVLLLAQLNRAVEGREDHRPTLADLRQSGDIEQDADTVSFVYRPEYYDRNEPERKPSEPDDKFAARVADWKEHRERIAGKAELVVCKVRNGCPENVSLLFDGDLTRFREAPQA